MAALHSAVTDEAVPSYAKVRAATALLGADRPERSPDSGWGRDPDESWRRPVFLPPKNGDSTVRYGQWREGQRIFIIPPGFKSEIQPEEYYKDVPKPTAADPRIAARERAKMLMLSGPADEGERE